MKSNLTAKEQKDILSCISLTVCMATDTDTLNKEVQLDSVVKSKVDTTFTIKRDLGRDVDYMGLYVSVTDENGVIHTAVVLGGEVKLLEGEALGFVDTVNEVTQCW